MSAAALRVGLLQCDHVAERFHALTPDYDALFRAMLVDAGSRADVHARAGQMVNAELRADGAPGRGEVVDAPGAGADQGGVDEAFQLVVYDAVHGELPAGVGECDAWLVTGSRFSAYDDEVWIHALEGFLRHVHEAARPVVGVCFGHQLLARALGGRVERAATGWGVGVQRTQVADGPAWDLYYLHQDQVVALPPGAVLLGSAAHCRIGMFALGARTFGIQAHPELDAGYLAALLRDRALRIGEGTVAAGLASLVTPTHSAAAARHLLGVLRGADARTPPPPS